MKCKCQICKTDLEHKEKECKITFYKCLDCERLYDTYKEAEECEKSHKKQIDVN